MSAVGGRAEVAITTADVRVCEGFRMPAHDDGATHTGAGVRKPPREETAGGRGRLHVRCYGDFAAGGVCGTFVERVLRTRSRRLAGVIGRPRLAEPALEQRVVDVAVAQVAVTAS